VTDLLPYLSYGVFFLTFGAFFAIVVLGLNLQWGFTGLFNVGVAGFVAVGAYASAILTAPPYADSLGGFGLPVAVGWIGAMLASGLVALIVGIPSLRLRHDYLAITTFGVATTLQLVALNARWLTGGPFGLQFIPRPMQGWLGTGPLWNAAYLAVALATLGLAYIAVERLVNGPWGRALRAIREDEKAAEALGKRAARFRLEAFVLGSMLMGLGGAVYAHFVGYIAPEDFLPILTFQVWTMLIVGGAGDNRGAILGAFAIWLIWSLSGGLIRGLLPQAEQARGAALQIVLIGVLLTTMLILRPRGLIGEKIGGER
jgi:branched-chain amino acid transport system permease protein